jgi:hypothetical protein
MILPDYPESQMSSFEHLGWILELPMLQFGTSPKMQRTH